MNVVDVDPEALDALLKQASSQPVLLDLWAPWCAPCRAQAPALEQLAKANEGRLQVVKLDVEKYPEVGKRLGVRGIPCLILFKDGQEISRKSGMQTREQLELWVAESGADVNPGPHVAPGRDDAADLGGAFYGDEELRDFLVGRLMLTASEERIVSSRFPYWAGGKGSVSAAFVRSDNRDVFERVSGLPLAFAMCLEFAGTTRSAQVQKIFDLVPAGADLGQLPARLVRDWLSDDEWQWPGILGSEADELRVFWTKACDATLAGETLTSDEWSEFRSRAEKFTTAKSEPTLAVQHHFASMLVTLSPVPATTEAAAWGRALLLFGKYLILIRSQYLDGWRTQEFAFEGLLHNWFTANCGNPRDKSPEEMQAFHQRFRDEHADLLKEHEPKQARFHANYEQLTASSYARVQEHLLEALRLEVRRTDSARELPHGSS